MATTMLVMATDTATATGAVVLCPGQGAQAVGMGRAWFEGSDAARDVFERADAFLIPHRGRHASKAAHQRSSRVRVVHGEVEAFVVGEQQGEGPQVAIGQAADSCRQLGDSCRQPAL